MAFFQFTLLKNCSFELFRPGLNRHVIVWDDFQFEKSWFSFCDWIVNEPKMRNKPSKIVFFFILNWEPSKTTDLNFWWIPTPIVFSVNCGLCNKISCCAFDYYYLRPFDEKKVSSNWSLKLQKDRIITPLKMIWLAVGILKSEKLSHRILSSMQILSKSNLKVWSTLNCYIGKKNTSDIRENLGGLTVLIFLNNFRLNNAWLVP